MLTLYVIPSEDKKETDIVRLRKSVNEVCDVIHVLDHGRLHEVNPETDWYAYLFSNEWLSEGLVFALPIFLQNTQYDFLMLYKKYLQKLQGLMTPKVFMTPRIFRSHVKLENNGTLMPQNFSDLKYVQVLDGWVLSPTRIIQ